jgi:hypothetical protein
MRRKKKKIKEKNSQDIRTMRMKTLQTSATLKKTERREKQFIYDLLHQRWLFLNSRSKNP